MNLVDFCCLTFLFVLSARGAWRGFVNEWAGLLGILGGYWMAIIYGPAVNLWLIKSLDFSLSYSLIAARFILFFGSYFTVAALGTLITKILKIVWLNWLNRLLGGASGLLKGAALLAIIIVVYNNQLASFFGLAPWLGNSVFFDLLKSVGEFFLYNSSELIDKNSPINIELSV